jgi:hypothetical protein
MGPNWFSHEDLFPQDFSPGLFGFAIPAPSLPLIFVIKTRVVGSEREGAFSSCFLNDGVRI